MMKKRKTISIIVTLAVLLYVVFGTGVLDGIGDNLKQVSASIMNSQKLDVNSKLNVYYFDVGQADSILVQNGKHNMLIDAGNNEDGPKLAEYMKSIGIKGFDYVIATHAHEDHVGGMDDVINNFSIDNFLMPDAVTTTKTFEDVLDALESKKLKYETPKVGDSFKVGDAGVTVLSVSSNASDLNDTSIVLKLVYGGHSFLFMGDASAKIENKILDKDISAEVLKVGHHGSEYSTSKAFLEKVKPSYAIISVGKDNVYNHPKKVVLERLSKMNVNAYRTDEYGTILISADGNGEILDIRNIETDLNG